MSSRSNQDGAHIGSDDGPVPVPPHSGQVAFAEMDQPDVASSSSDTPASAGNPKADQNDDYASYAAIAQILSSEPGDDSGLPSEDALRQLNDETIERLVETNLAERYERFTRLVELQPVLDEGVVTGLRVIPRSPPGADLLLGVGLFQNDVIIGINGNGFPPGTPPESLPGSLVVNLLMAPGTRLKVLRGGSETLVIVEPVRGY